MSKELQFLIIVNQLALIFLRDLIFKQAKMPLSSPDRPTVVEYQPLLPSVPHHSSLILFLILSVLLLLGVMTQMMGDSPRELLYKVLKAGIMHSILEG